MQYPYDSYILKLKILIHYPNATLLSNDTIPLSRSDKFLNTENDLWNITNTDQHFSHEGNDTNMQLTFSLKRFRPPTQDPLLIVGCINFVLLISAIMFKVEDIEKRLQVYLTAVIVPITVLIGVKLNPLGFGLTIYEKYFTYVMAATVIFVFFSIMAFRLKKYRISSWLDFVSGSMVGGIGFWLFWSTSLPFIGQIPIFILFFSPILIKVISNRKNTSLDLNSDYIS